MPTRVNPTAAKKAGGYSPTQSFDEEGQVIDNSPPTRKEVPISSQTKGTKRLINKVFAVRPHPKKGEGVSGIIIAMLLTNKSTNEDILAAIAKKHGQEMADLWGNRITIFRSDINSGRRMVNKVKELGVKLPLLRLVRQGKQLVPAEPRKRYGVLAKNDPAPIAVKAPIDAKAKAKVPAPKKAPVVITKPAARTKAPSAKIVPVKKVK